jgi:aminopeptidase-like protein
MNITQFNHIKSQSELISDELYQLMIKLYPICRSITGEGVRKSHQIISEYVSLQTKEIPSGTKVFDWNIPKEWNINDAYVLDSKGNKIIDFKKSNLHILNYSIPINKKVTLDELKKHLHTLPDQPDLIPYLTTYYNEDWGFCISHNQFLELKEDEYHVCIDSTLENGSLTYSECILKGKTSDEVVISCYTCHPSLCNDNLSGVVLTSLLAKYLSNLQLNYSYRFLFIPETIGAIAWLSSNQNLTSIIKHGLVVTCVGDSGISTYKKSRMGDAEIDKVVENMLKNSGNNYKIINFFPSGSDERQFSSPGFNLPFGSLMRTMYGQFSEYHTSADNLQFIKKDSLIDSFLKYLTVIFILENNHTYINLNPKCEPHLGKRGLYNKIGGEKSFDQLKQSILWVLNLSDGKHSLLDISNTSGFQFDLIKDAADVLIQNSLLKLQS